MALDRRATRADLTEDDRTRLLALAAAGLAVGALAGLVGTAFHVALDGAERLRASMLDWAHGSPAVGWLASVLLAGTLPGGLFAPLLIVGVAAGMLFGMAVETLNPAVTTPLSAFAAVGMSALFVGVVRAPTTGVALVVEMTGATSLFVPLLTAWASSVAVPSMLGTPPIYDTLQAGDGAQRRASAME